MPVQRCRLRFSIYVYILDVFPHLFVVLPEQKDPSLKAFLNLKVNRS